MSGYLHLLSTKFLETGSPTEPEAHRFNKLASQGVLGNQPVSTPYSTRVTHTCNHAQLVCGYWRFELRSSGLCGRYFID